MGGPSMIFCRDEIAHIHDFGLQTPKQQPKREKPLDLDVHTQFSPATLVRWFKNKKS